MITSLSIAVSDAVHANGFFLDFSREALPFLQLFTADLQPDATGGVRVCRS